MFVPYSPKWSKSRYLKAEALWLPQKLRTVFVWFLLLGIHILVYSCKGCGTSKNYLCLEDNRSSFSWLSLKSETKEASSNSRSLLFAKDMILEKQKFDLKEVEGEEIYVSPWGRGGARGNFTHSSWFPLNNAKTVKAATLEFCNILLETFAPNLVSINLPSLQILCKIKTAVFPISGFLVNS